MYKNGAYLHPDGICTFCVWAPLKQQMTLHIVHPWDHRYAMEQDEEGYFHITLQNIPEGTRYFYEPSNTESFPDPASFAQPDGVHGASMIINHNAYNWKDKLWKNIPLQEMILYEIHTGTFTAKGTFSAIIDRLEELAATGINAIELMPVAQFPGDRNWGYDGVYPYAVQWSYGGAEELKLLVDACHQKGIAVILDVVYNHLGPEGNYFGKYAPYFTATYSTPWGDAINYDGAWSDGVRDFFVENMLYWFEYFHIDGLRIDAIHTIYDNRGDPFWAYVHEKIKALEQKLGRRLYLIAESDLNSPRVIQPPAVNGFGFDAQWLDDFHHALYVLVHKEGRPLYVDFGSIQQLAKAYNEGFVHSGEYVKARKRKHGISSAGIDGDRFIAFIQNHDQVGNKVNGNRLSSIIDMPSVKIAAAALLLSPYIPLLFMGEEYAEPSPFLYFIDHSDKALIQAVREGRKKEFESLWGSVLQPDPQDETTFLSSKLKWRYDLNEEQKEILNWYKELILLRKTHPALQVFNKQYLHAEALQQQGISIIRKDKEQKECVLMLINFDSNVLSYRLPSEADQWIVLLSSAQQYKQGQCYSSMHEIQLAKKSVVILQGKQ